MVKLLTRLLLFIFFIVLSCEAIAQNNLPPVYEIKEDTTVIDTLPNAYWQMLEDKNGKLSFEQVSKSPITDRFHFDTAKRINYSISNYWFRFRLKNATNHPLKIGFYDIFTYDILDWYIVSSNNGITHKTNGFETPWGKRDDLKLIGFLPVTIQPAEELLFYNRAHYDYFNFFLLQPRKFFIEYGTTDKVIEQDYIDNETHYFNSVHDAFFFGAMLLSSIFSFFFFLIVRERVYLYFSLYVFFLGFGRFNIEFEFYHVFLREHPLFYAYFFNFVWLPAEFFLAFFIRALLQTKKFYPNWDKFLFYWAFLYAVAWIVLLFTDYYFLGTSLSGLGTTIDFFITMVLHVSLVITLFLFIRQKFSFDKQFLLAIIPSFTIWVVGNDIYKTSELLQYWVHLKPSSPIIWLYKNWFLIETICLGWQVLCFSWYLMHRFVELRKQVVQKELEKEIERSQLIEQQKVELEKTVEERTAELKQSLHELKSTQAQLIHSEKMASLGELTAGIAHEIQNPLNFVNNFSEVNKELIEELNAERLKPKADRDDQLENEIINDLKDNSEKINHHGKRADAIVKNMLQHSKQTKGIKEPTDINALCDEYLRLSYHGMRAKDKNFNAEIKTDFDESIGKINVVPQDIGRVLLNLFNNAFYAVNEKAKLRAASYKPRVTVQTKKINDKIEIKVSDNGSGIPQNIIDKIFQPFFTTKPTGEGTGLGLSLSYDIIKAHGGEIKVETKEGAGSEFIFNCLYELGFAEI